MKKLFGLLVLSSALSVAGCITPAPEATHPAPTAPLSAVKTPPPVTPDQVTSANGHQIAQKLAAELDRDGKEP